MNYLRAIYNRFFGVQGAAHTGNRVLALGSIFEDSGEWYFSQTDARHQNGQIHGPFYSLEDAETARDTWQEKNSAVRLVRA
jgi:hypothetical protein